MIPNAYSNSWEKFVDNSDNTDKVKFLSLVFYGQARIHVNNNDKKKNIK